MVFSMSRNFKTGEFKGQNARLHMSSTSSKFFLEQVWYLQHLRIEAGLLAPLDVGISVEYDLSSVYICAWLTFLLAEKRLKAIMVSPPCTAFSVMRRPRLRSAQAPFGFDTKDE